MDLSHEGSIEQKRKEVVRLAHELLVGEEDFLSSVRKLSGLRHEVGVDSAGEDFNIFLVIDSETDHLPQCDLRSQCSPEWIQKSDKELRDFEAFYHSDLETACHRLIATFSPRS